MFNQFTKLRNKKGFSLIEVMVVVAIIAIMTAVAVPAYLSYKKDTKKGVALASIDAIVDSMNGYTTIRQSELGVFDSEGNIQGTIQTVVDKLVAAGMHVTVDSIKLDAPLEPYCYYDSSNKCFFIKNDVDIDVWVALYDDGTPYEEA